MIINSSAGWGTIIVSLFVAFVLAIVPLPEWLIHWRPAWVALVVIYWVIAQPHRFGVIAAWLTGLMLDVLVNNTLGQNAVALAVIAYTSYVLHMRIRVFPLWQQCLSILVLVGIYQLVSILVMRAVQITPWTFWYWVSVVASAIVWPLVSLALGYLRGQRGG